MRVGLLALASVLSLLSACDSGEPLTTDIATQDNAARAEAGLPDVQEPVVGAAIGGPAEVGTWGDVLQWPHVAVSMASLPNGQVLSYSGSERRTWPTTEQTYSSVWDPETGVFQENLHRGHNMFCAALSMTSDGKVLVNGGRNQGNSPWTTLFDYRNNEWQTIDNMASGGRWYPTTLATGDGSVLTALGTSTNTRNPDVWDPDTGWRVLNGIDFLNMRQRNNQRGRDNSFPLLSVAPNGNIYHYWDTVENQMINTQGNGESRPANPTTDGLNHAGGVQLMYDIGKLISVGRNDGSWGGNSGGASSEAFTIDLNGAVPDIRATSNMRHRRKFQQLVPFPTGEVMVVGGNTSGAKFQDNGSVLEAEVWNPQTGQWRGMANMAVPRDYHSTAMLLTDGRVLTAGGGYDAGNPNSSGTHQDAQIFSPPYLYASNGTLATRPQVTAAQASVDAGEEIQVSTTGNIAYFSLIRMSSTTHAMNTDARFYKPEFAAAGTNQYSVTIHQNPNVSIPGYWMLFAVDADGVPSKAQVIRITALDTRLDNLALQGTATQSSDYTDNANIDVSASIAIDGDLSGGGGYGLVTHTNSDTQAWWQLDLGRVVDIDTIRVWNRTDCCADRLSDFHVLVSSQPFVSTDLNMTRAQSGVLDFHTQGVAGRQTDVKVGTQGRYVRVQLAGTNVLHLAEVQVFGAKRTDIANLAVSGVASQSSTYQNTATYAALKAIDGNTNGDNGNNGAGVRTIGGGGGGPFERTCRSNEVLAGMYGTTGTYVNSVGARCVSVDSNGNWVGNPRNAGASGGNGGSSYSRTCPVGWGVSGFSGRADAYVDQITLQCQKLSSATSVSGVVQQLQSSGRNSGTARGPITCGGVATGISGRSGSWMDAFGLQCPNPGTGVISHTGNDVNSWWELDLGRVVEVDSVVIWNRTDCCSERLSNFHLFVSDQPFNSKSLNTTIAQSGVYNRFVSGAAPRTTELVVGRTGRYLRVQLNTANTPVPLQLAEVQVMGAELSAPLNVQPMVATPKQQGASVSFTASATGSGALQYRWNFGDGNADTPYSTSPSVSHSYAEPGRYVVSLTVRDGIGEEVRSTFTQVVHAPLLSTKSKSSGGVLEHSTRTQVWNVNPDNNSVGVVDTQSLSLLAEIAVGLEPVSLAEAADGNIWVVNRKSANISVIDPSSLSVIATHALPRASQPYGIVMDNAGAVVALQAIGKVQRVALDGSAGASAIVGANPRHLTLNPMGNTLYVSRYITNPLPGEDTANVIVDDGVQKYGGEVLVLDATTLITTQTIVLQHVDRVVSEHEGPGVPNYLGPVVISPAGGIGWLPSKQDNILAGELRGGEGITFDQTVRAITSKLDLTANEEILSSRIDHDNASVAGHSAFDPFGVTLFTSLEGNRQISVIDAETGIEIGRFDTGRAPQGLTVSKDGKRIYVHNFMDRTISVFDIESITQTGATAATELATINVVSNELLNGTVLRGKQLFYDARDDRLAGLDYMSCASCHVDGEHDGRTWDFTSLGEGLRNTITLKGRAGTGHGILHWTGNFDEVQDFEGQIRDFAGGSGLMNDTDFEATRAPLGASKAGLSTDLDAMAAYLESLDTVDESPLRNPDGTMTAAALNGESLLVSKGCVTCHAGLTFTDSNAALLHDVGTLMPESGLRLGAALTGLDTPSLLGVWRTAPYLHDGSAPTLEDAIAAHVGISVTATEQADLASYLSQLDGGAPVIELPPPPPPNPPAPATPGVSNPLTAGIVVVDGNLDEWSTAASFGIDPSDASGNNTIDWAEATLMHNDSNFYIAYRNHNPVAESWGYGIYIDVDGNTATGFRGFSAELPIGSDFLIEGRTVQKYTGTGTDWSWQEIGYAAYNDNADTAELSVPRALLGNPNTLRLYFNGNNTAVGGDTVDFYPDQVTDASRPDIERYFTYTTSNTGGNSPPVGVAQNLSVDVDTALPITLTGTDLNGDNLNFEITDQPANGVLAGNPPNVVYTPASGFQGADQFTFTVSDGSATSAPAVVSIIAVGETPTNLATITVDGSLADWATVSSFGTDPVDATGAGDVIDWLEGWVAHDNSNFYLAYVNNKPVVLNWGFGVYIDTDNNPATGFRNFDGSYPIGVDYIIESNELQKYTGTGTNWSWAQVSSNQLQVSGENVEMAIPRSALGNPTQLNLFFVGENSAVNGTTVDYYPDNATVPSAPVRFFTYNAAQAVNVAPVAETQTLTMNQDGTLVITLAATDANGGALTYQVTRQPSNGVLTGSAPNMVYTPNAGFNGADSFEFRANDGSLSGDPAVVTISVNATTTVPSGSNPVGALTIDGSLQDWAGITPFAADAADITSTAEKIDWRQSYLAHSPTTLYLAYQNDTPIAQLTYGHAVYIGTDDSNATGFLGFSSELPFGADFLLEGTDLYQYSGSGNNWLWTYIATINAQQVGNVAEFGLSRAQLGNPAAIEIFWRGANEAVGGTGVDFYPDAVTNIAAPVEQRRYRYVMQP